jgi:integrase
MKREREELTDAAVNAYKGDERAYPVLWDGLEPGFGVRRSKKTGEKTFIYQRRVKGSYTERSIKIGRVGEQFIDKNGKVFSLSVEKARAKATAHRLMMTEELTDPVAERQRKEAEKRQREQEEREAAERAEAESITLREVMEDYLLHHRTKHGRLRPATRADYRHHVEVNLKDWADRPVTTITRAMCVEKFVELSQRAPGQANSLLIYLRALLNHARIMKEDDDGEPTILATNPAARAIKFVKLNAEKPRTGRIPLDRVGHCWNLLRERAKNPRTRTVADWISIVLLTGARKTESASLMWENVDFDNGTIRFPGEVTKNHHELVLPMSDAMRDILEARKPAKLIGYVFPSRSGTTFVNDPRDTLDAMKDVVNEDTPTDKPPRIKELTLHDLRRGLDDIATECKIDSDVRRALLNHITTDVHGKHYSNANGKALQAATAAIASWVTNAGKVAAGRNVVPLPARAQREVG